jgi:hypothetical protein
MQRTDIITKLRTVIAQARADGHYIAPFVARGMTTAQLCARLDEIERLLGARASDVPTSAMIAEMQAEITP